MNIKAALVRHQRNQLVQLTIGLAEVEESYKEFKINDMREKLKSNQLLGMGMQTRLFLYRQQLGISDKVEGAGSSGAYKG